MASADESLDMYTYSPLSGARDVRLLDLHPSEKRNDSIHCTIRHVCLDDQNSYEALSYTWGDASQHFDISCNGASLKITHNLNVALRYLRSTIDLRTLWVDAICINQSDFEERSQQVQLMRDVYSKARPVIAWIGDERGLQTAVMDLENSLTVAGDARDEEKAKTFEALANIERPENSDDLIAIEAEPHDDALDGINKSGLVQTALDNGEVEKSTDIGTLVVATDDDSNAIQVKGIDAEEVAQDDPKTLEVKPDDNLSVLGRLRKRGKDKASKWSTDLVKIGAKRLVEAAVSPQEITERPWFSRAWIIQEVALSTKLILQCGPRTVSWKNFYYMARALAMETSGERIPAILSNSPMQRVQLIESTRAMVQAKRDRASTSLASYQSTDEAALKTQWRSFESLVSSARSYGATNSKDHIYALLGLVDPDIGRQLGVDYDSDTLSVFRGYVRNAIVKGDSLSILGQIDGSPSQGYPSWVAALDRPSLVVPLSSTDVPSYTASGDSKIRLNHTDELDALELSGITVDTINEIVMGPCTDRSKSHGRAQNFIFDKTSGWNVTDVVAEGVKKSASTVGKAVAHQTSKLRKVPKVQEVEDNLKAGWHVPEWEEDDEAFLQMITVDSNGVIDFNFNFINMSFHQAFTSNADENFRHGTVQAKRTMAAVSNFLAEKRRQRQNYLYGSMHPTDEVYMEPSIETGWKALSKRANKTVYKEGLEEAYWRTLVGNKRSQSAGPVREVPDIWHEAYYIWREMLLDQEGLLPRVFNGRGLKIKEPISTLAGMKPAPKKEYKPISPELQHYFDLIDANQKGEETNNIEVLPALQRLTHGLAMIANHKDSEFTHQATPDEEDTPGASYDMRRRTELAFWYDLLQTARNRQFCVTRKGYMGWAPPTAKPGDCICIFFGGQVPYVVRPNGKEYEFLGEAYIHGIMNGEALSMEGIKMETFCLR